MAELLAPLITVMVITHDEAPNIQRCLDALGWATRILVIDSGSTDDTVEIACSYPTVKIVERPFDDFAGQCNFGLSIVETPWVLSLDADYVLSPTVQLEITELQAGAYVAYEAAFIYCIYGRPLRGTLYPPRCVLYQRDHAYYRNEGHGHRVEIDGPIGKLQGKIYHDDRKPLSRFIASQKRYARLEADYLLTSERSKLRYVDRIRLMGWPAPILIFFYTLLWKRCVQDGWPGWLYVLQRTLAETMIALEVVDRRVRGREISLL